MAKIFVGSDQDGHDEVVGRQNWKEKVEMAQECVEEQQWIYWSKDSERKEQDHRERCAS